MIVLGWCTQKIKSYLIRSSCNSCHHSELIYLIFQKFFNIFWIPFIPLGKKFGLTCPRCGMNIPLQQALEVDPPLKTHTPWWGYTGVTLFAILVVIINADSIMFPPIEPKLENIKMGDTIIVRSGDARNFPYDILKIVNITDDICTFVPCKRSFQSINDANECFRRNSPYSFHDQSFEVSMEIFRKLDIKRIERSKTKLVERRDHECI